VARAKRTARADARRRHRAQAAASADADFAEDLEPEESGPGGRERPPSGRERPPGDSRRGQQRMGFLAAFRAAYEPVRIREDIAGLPALITSRAVVLPAVLVVISAVVLILAINAGNVSAGGTAFPSASPSTAAASSSPTSSSTTPSTSAAASASTGASASAASAAPSASGATNGAGRGSGSPLGLAASLLSLLFLQIPPIGGIYAAAVLAKRASYLAGGIAGLMGALGLTAVLYTVPVEGSIGDVRFEYAIQAILTSTIFGVLLGGGLGYYRRLLRYMSGPRPQRSASRAKPARRR
jgi:hypothetical protein